MPALCLPASVKWTYTACIVQHYDTHNTADVTITVSSGGSTPRYLDGNNRTTLPAGLIDRLTSLQELYLSFHLRINYEGCPEDACLVPICVCFVCVYL